MTFESFQETVRAEIEREPGASSWDVHFSVEEPDTEWLIIVVAGSAFASLAVPASFATKTSAPDIVRQLERMVTSQQGPPALRSARAR